MDAAVKVPKSPRFQAKIAAPFGMIGVRTEGELVAAIVYLPPTEGAVDPSNALAERVCLQIGRYLENPDCKFDLPLKDTGTPFQRRVWKALASIPRGCTRRYGEIARELDSGPRAIGQACGANPFPLVVPCHRVVSSNGIGGFANHDTGYYPRIKHWLLEHEQRGK